MKSTCSNCGEPVEDGMAFCRKCGTRVAENASETPAKRLFNKIANPEAGTT